MTGAWQVVAFIERESGRTVEEFSQPMTFSEANRLRNSLAARGVRAELREARQPAGTGANRRGRRG